MQLSWCVVVEGRLMSCSAVVYWEGLVARRSVDREHRFLWSRSSPFNRQCIDLGIDCSGFGVA